MHPKSFVAVNPAAEPLGNGTLHAAPHELSVNVRPSCLCSDLDGSATDNHHWVDAGTRSTMATQAAELARITGPRTR